ncbi:MAG: hypothetical protein M3Y22_13340 [Pseudomonadota bacterium]|nr:hypothetical protein [Pseudomonadota bacterium]
MSENGTSLITNLIDGKLQSPKSGAPSAVQADADGWIGGCVWHEDAATVRFRAPSPGKSQDITVDPLGLGRIMVEELQG